MSDCSLPKTLRGIREKFGYTQQQIADVLCIDRSTYSYYETGKTRPDLATLVTLAEIFQTTVDGLLGTAAPAERETRKRKPGV